MIVIFEGAWAHWSVVCRISTGSYLRIPGRLSRLFELTGHIFTDVLYAAADEHFSGDFYPHKLGRVDTSFLGIEFVDV
jgi:hypothetical protein